MKTCRRKWLARWLAACIAVVLGMGMCAGLPVSAATSAELTISQNGIDFIKAREGFSAKCYYDGAQSSIGYGTKCGTKAHASGLHSITKAAAEVAMRQEIVSSYIPNVRRQTSGLQMNQNQFDALVSFTYNTGGGTSMIKNSPLVKYLRGEMSQAAAASAFESYVVTNSATGKVDSGLKNRRRLEAKLFFSGVNPNPPKWAKVTLDHYAWMAGETLTFNLSSEGGVAYTVGIDTENADGGRTRIDTHDTRDTSYSRSFNNPGKYSCYITTYNEYGLADSERIYFEVYDKKPENVSVSLDHYGWMLNENMTFTCSSVHGYAYTIGIDDANGNRIDTYDTTGNTYTRSFSTPGKYSCYITTYNGYGYADSERIYFEVYDKKPENVSVSLDHYGWMLNENMTFTCSSVHGYAYTIGIDDANGNRIDTYDTTGKTYTRSFSTPGKYSCYITTYNGYGYADSERIYFEVYDGKPTNAKVELDKDSYYVGEELVFRCSSEHGYVYTIGIDSEDGGRTRIDTYDTKESSYTRSFSKPGKYSCYITTYNGYGLADSERIYFTILPSPGDLNFDNTLTTADAVLLQRYLLQERTLTQSQWQTADLNADGTVNGFDLALLRQKLVG